MADTLTADELDAIRIGGAGWCSDEMWDAVFDHYETKLRALRAELRPLLIEPASFTEAEREVLKSTALGRKTLRVVAELEAFIRSLSEPLFDDEAWGPVCAWCGYEVTTSGHDKDCAWTRRAALTGEGA